MLFWWRRTSERFWQVLAERIVFPIYMKQKKIAQGILLVLLCLVSGGGGGGGNLDGGGGVNIDGGGEQDV